MGDRELLPQVCEWGAEADADKGRVLKSIRFLQLHLKILF